VADLPARADVVVVGAGMAGLVAAGALNDAGYDTLVVEASDGVGGRVRSDHVDGLTLDRGFQLLNPSYPAAADLLDLEALALRPFASALLVAMGGRRYLLADPRRDPLGGPRALAAPVGSLRAKLALARYALRVSRADPAALVAQPDGPAQEALREAGASEALLDTVLRPFLAGVFLESDLTTSRRFLDLVLRSFVLAAPAVPAGGMGAIGDQLASRLPAGTVRLGTPARSLRAGRVVTDAGTVGARVVIVATDAGAAARLLPGLVVPARHGVTTDYHLADCEPGRLAGGRAVLTVDGQRRGPVLNTVVLTHAAPTYAPDGQVLVSTSHLGVGRAAERDVRGHLGLLYGVDTRGWTPVARYPVPDALPAMDPPHEFRKPVRLEPGLLVCGDHRDSSSLQGALVSGRRAARAALSDLRR